MCFYQSARRRLSLSQPDLQTKYLLLHRLILSPGKMISAPGESRRLSGTDWRHALVLFAPDFPNPHRFIGCL
ncbi:hypothetical protein CEXT_82451 [Caerostris extrusa]|uniref:Ycf15 n=1 Tax=Caerostris extrusa TaxID=172846 RepID=A0AAV4PCG3_CAEEX|nr:hypothetical protein CEXT_82451 [Caerostris extrusa]